MFSYQLNAKNGWNLTVLSQKERAFYIIVAIVLTMFFCGEVLAQKKVTGLPVPRFVSLKSNLVNLRQGPSNEHAIKLVFKKSGLPVEIIAEYDNWRRIRDSEGTDGWVWHSLLSGNRTALVAPWSSTEMMPLSIHQEPDETSKVVARLQPNVIVAVELCDNQWCQIELNFQNRTYSGYFQQNKLWGVYPDEVFD